MEDRGRRRRGRGISGRVLVSTHSMHVSHRLDALLYPLDTKILTGIRSRVVRPSCIPKILSRYIGVTSLPHPCKSQTVVSCEAYNPTWVPYYCLVTFPRLDIFPIVSFAAVPVRRSSFFRIHLSYRRASLRFRITRHEGIRGITSSLVSPNQQAPSPCLHHWWLSFLPLDILPNNVWTLLKKRALTRVHEHHHSKRHT